MSEALAAARRRDVEQRRARVRAAVHEVAVNGTEVSMSSVARAANVHRSFIHRHPELRALVLEAAANPVAGLSSDVRASRRSLEAENLNLNATIQRQQQFIADLEARLTELLGEQTFARTGLGAAASHADLQRTIDRLQQEAIGLRAELTNRDEELAAARETNRRLMSTANRTKLTP